MDLLRVRRLFVGEQVARFGTSGPGGHPAITPVPFALIDDGDAGVAVCTLDVQPRSLACAALLRHLADSPRASLLVDAARLEATRPSWWVRADGVAEVIRRNSDDPRYAMAARALAARYGADFCRTLLTVVWTTITRWDGWIGAEHPAVAA